MISTKNRKIRNIVLAPGFLNPKSESRHRFSSALKVTLANFYSFFERYRYDADTVP